MKVRKGFVSNSSSCSFVIAGVCVDCSDTPSEVFDELYELDLLVTEADNGKDYVIGFELADSEDWGLEHSTKSIQEVSDMLDKVKRIVAEHGIKTNFAGIICGTRQC